MSCKTFSTFTITVVIFLSGCASLKQQSNFNSFNEQITAGNYNAASQTALKLANYDPLTNKTDDLLWTMQAGATLNATEQYSLSTKLLDVAEDFMKEQDLKNITETSIDLASSLLVNDATIAYSQTQYDGVITNTLKAWNFIATGDFANARVELNRAEERQRRATEHFATKIKKQQEQLKRGPQDVALAVTNTINASKTTKALQDAGFMQNQWLPYAGYINPYVTYFYALNLMVSNNVSDKAQAADAFKRVYGLTGAKTAKQSMELASSLANGASKTNLHNRVWIIAENGLSTIKEEQRIILPIFIASNNVFYTGIALPKLKKRNIAFNLITVNGHALETISDMDKIISAEFNVEFSYILAREIARTTLKTVAQKQLADQNPLLGAAAGLLQIASTRADIRTFSVLPSIYQATSFTVRDKKIEIKAGNFVLPIVLDESAKQHIIYIKAATSSVAPLVKVINI